MSQVHVVAIVTPAKGKESRVRELLVNLANDVKNKESDVSKYELFEQINGDGVNVFVVEETYKDQATLDSHMKTEYFQALGGIIQEEGLLAAGLDIKTIKPIGGFGPR